jgi:hypothetical protein
MCKLKANEAQIVFWNDVYHIYRPDGYYAIEVMTSCTEYGALEFCAKNNWKVIR